jgi:hypothetical protein
MILPSTSDRDGRAKQFYRLLPAASRTLPAIKMNYFAHGRRFLDDPYFLAGTAVPDCLGVVDRPSRVRTRQAAAFIDDADPQLAAVARGIVQHHFDDGWFHGNAAFAHLSWQFANDCRMALGQDEGFRPSFLGHILVELLLDAVLIKRNSQQLRDYYVAMQCIDPAKIECAVNQMSPRPSDRLAKFIERFCQVGFLWDYSDDTKLLFRLNQVMGRVGLDALPESFCEFLASSRKLVATRADELLIGQCDGAAWLSERVSPARAG